MLLKGFSDSHGFHIRPDAQRRAPAFGKVCGETGSRGVPVAEDAWNEASEDYALGHEWKEGDERHSGGKGGCD